jgi:peroxiredoxin
VRGSTRRKAELKGRKTMRPLLMAYPMIGLLTLAAVTSCLAGEVKAPDFTLANLEGEDVKLSDLLAKGPVILDFWATWCKPCIKGFPGLQELLNKYEDRGLTVVAVSVDSPKSRVRVGPFISSKNYSFEVLLDTQGRVARKYNAVTIPRTVLISPDGMIAHATVGYRPSNHEQIEKSLLPLLPEPSAEGSEVVE